MQARHLFGNENKYCEWCNRPLPKGYEGTLCAGCQENAFFREIRDYVRKHDVNEFELAEAFGIPLRRVKKWIREGRLEYKETAGKMENLHCVRCGKPITFGSLCPECSRAQTVGSGYEIKKKDTDASEQIRFYNKNKV